MLNAFRDPPAMRYNESLFDIADWLTEPPSGGPVQARVVGIGLAAIVTGYGIWCCIVQHATTLNVTMRGFQPLGRGLWLEIHGVHAVTFGLLVTCIGLFIHFQWFWGNHERLFPYHEISKYIAALGVVMSMVAHAFTMITGT